jgi:hypothetical protein
LNKGNKKYYEAGYAVHELAAKALYIYGDENTDDEDRRMLLSYAFSNIVLYADKIKPEYTLAFDFLRNWIPKVNSTLELEKNLAQKRQKDDFSPSRPILLALVDDFRTIDWVNEYPFPNIALQEIKSLLV